jgi:hypothetical protein
VYIESKQDETYYGEDNKEYNNRVKKDGMIVVYQEKRKKRVRRIKQEECKREQLYFGKKIADSRCYEGCECYE